MSENKSENLTGDSFLEKSEVPTEQETTENVVNDEVVPKSVENIEISDDEWNRFCQTKTGEVSDDVLNRIADDMAKGKKGDGKWAGIFAAHKDKINSLLIQKKREFEGKGVENEDIEECLKNGKPLPPEAKELAKLKGKREKIIGEITREKYKNKEYKEKIKKELLNIDKKIEKIQFEQTGIELTITESSDVAENTPTESELLSPEESKLDLLKEKKRDIIGGKFTTEELENDETLKSVDEALVNIDREIKTEENKEKIKKIFETINLRRTEIRKEALSLKEKVKGKALLMMIKASGAYQRIPPKGKMLLWAGIASGVVISTLFGVLDNDSNEQIQTMTESLSETLDGTGAEAKADTSNFSAENIAENTVPPGFSEKLDIQHEPLTFTAGEDAEHVWGGVENVLDDKGLMEGYDDIQRTQTIDAVKDKLSKMNPEELKKIGISSGDISLVYPGEVIDLSSVIEAKEDLFTSALESGMGDVPDSVSDPIFSFTEGEDAGHVWGGIEKVLDERDLMEGYDDSQRIQTIDAIKDDLATWSPEELKKIGISSGDIGFVQPGEVIDLSSVIEAKEDLLAYSLEGHMRVETMKDLFSSLELPTYMSEHRDLFSMDIHGEDWMNSDKGIASHDINDFCNIDPEILSGSVGVDSKVFVQETQDLIEHMKSFGHTLPDKSGEKTVFEYLHRALGPFFKK